MSISIVRSSKPLVAALGLLALLRCTEGVPVSRAVRPLHGSVLAPPEFSRSASVGLFVGVRSFPHDSRLTVPYAVDDAIDLAHRFALDARVGLVPPRRVVLALSGTPQKEESKQRLRELREAGARVHDATSGDILNLLKEQAARAGSKGLLVLSIASHGFQQDGDAWILGSTSTFGSPETALRTATLLDVASRVPRSLIFIDACRDRIGQDTRGATPDPAAAAPHIRRMARVRGQVIFYAAAPGQYAFDDLEQKNGVFTRAVLDGLDCEASSPRGTVVVETLHMYVDRTVRRWIRDNRNRIVNPATQISMEGETRNMPLSQCWRTASLHIRAAIDGSIVTTYADDTRPLWRKDFGAPVVHAEVADLDADAFAEIIVGLGDRIIVHDREGRPLWSRGVEAMTLRSFTTADLFEKKTSQIVAVWNDERAPASRLTIFDSDGRERSKFDYAGLLQDVAVGRPTNLHAPKIAVAARRALLLLHPRKIDGGKPVWQRVLPASPDVRTLTIADANHDSRRDIAVSTANGTRWFDFQGMPVRRSEPAP